MGLTDRTGVSVSVSGLAQLVWSDVAMMAVYSIVGLVLALVLSPVCNLLALDDKTVRGLGVNVDLVRFVISVAAVLLVSGVTAVIGVVGFLALDRAAYGTADRRLRPPYSGALLYLAGRFCAVAGGYCGPVHCTAQ